MPWRAVGNGLFPGPRSRRFRPARHNPPRLSRTPVFVCSSLRQDPGRSISAQRNPHTSSRRRPVRAISRRAATGPADQRFFSFANGTDPDRIHFARDRSATALGTVGLAAELTRAGLRRTLSFQSAFSVEKPRPIQVEAALPQAQIVVTSPLRSATASPMHSRC